MPRRVDLPADLTGRPFSVRKAREHGVAAGRLRARDLWSPFAGVRVAVPAAGDMSPPRSVDEVVAAAREAAIAACRAYATRMHDDHAFSHVTAAILHGVPLPMRFARERPLDVCAQPPGRAPEARGVRGRQLAREPQELCSIDGLRATGPDLTWCTLATELPLADLVAAADFLVTPRTRDAHPLSTIERLAATVERRSGLRGYRRLRDALSLIRVGPRSRPETLVRLLVTGVGLPEPEINVEIRDAQGRFVAMPDLSWPAYRVALEYEGDYHRTRRGQFESDLRRIERLVDAGWLVIRVSAVALFDDPRGLVRLVERRLRSRGWMPDSAIDMRKVAHFER